MTSLEERQIGLLARYQKQSILRFVLQWGTLLASFSAGFSWMDETSYFRRHPAWLLAFLPGGWFFGFGLRFFAVWYLTRIKRRVETSAGNDQFPSP